MGGAGQQQSPTPRAGKTTLAMNRVKALADSERFLGRFPVLDMGEGRVAYSNYEMAARQNKTWWRDLDIENPEYVAMPLQLRGKGLSLGEDEVRKRLVDYLGGNDVKYWVVDTLMRASFGIVESEGDNVQMDRLLALLDQIKEEADVPDLLLTHHTGRGLVAEGAERSRGWTRLEDWMDSGWYLTVDDTETRSLRANGRDVWVEAFDLAYDADTRRVNATGYTRKERRDMAGVRHVLDALANVGDAATTTELREAMAGDKNLRNSWIRDAARNGYVVRKYEDGTPHDERIRTTKALRCFWTNLGRELREGAVRRDE